MLKKGQRLTDCTQQSQRILFSPVGTAENGYMSCVVNEISTPDTVNNDALDGNKSSTSDKIVEAVNLRKRNKKAKLWLLRAGEVHL